jgi:putative ABC transport system permease protein
MRTSSLLARNLRWYWRTNLAALFGVAVVAGVLGGAVLVGQSVRASLREIALARLGRVDTVISRNGFVRETLASAFLGSAPVISMEATVSNDAGRRVSNVQFYGIDRRFWHRQGLTGTPPSGGEAILTRSLARELNARPGNAVLARVRRPSAIPLESLHGRKEEVGLTIRLNVAASARVEFSLQPQQSDLEAIYVPLDTLQRDLSQQGRVNTILLGSDQEDAGAKTAQVLHGHTTLADLGISLHLLQTPAAFSLETDSALISDALADAATAAAKSLGLHAQPVLTYLANSIRLDCAESDPKCPAVPYSVVTAIDSELAPAKADGT